MRLFRRPRVRSVLAALAWVAIIEGTVAADLQQPPAQGASSKETSQNSRGTEQSPLVIRVVQPAKSEAETSEETRARREVRALELKRSALDQRLADATDDLAFWTKILALVALVQFAAIIMQTWILRRTLRATEQAAKSADYAVRSAESTAVHELRAYISATPDHIYNFSVTQALGIKATIRNAGKTPAYGVAPRSRVALLPFPLPANYQFPELPPVSAAFTLHPEETIFHTTYSESSFTQAEINAAIDGSKLRIYMFGEISYEDAFGQKRITEFCRMIPGGDKLQIVATGGRVTEGGFPFHVTEQHNHAT